jgi:hypothetical protein
MTSLTDDQLTEIMLIAETLQPEEDGIHDWCGQASDAAAAYLTEEGMEATAVPAESHGTFMGCAHRWVELADGTIIDLTIEQFCYGQDRIATPHYPGADGGYGIAIIAPGDPFAGHYERERQPT